MKSVDKVREKIAALLKKTEANGASEAEAAAAMNIAAKLMAEHGVSLKDIAENNDAANDFTKVYASKDASNLSILDKLVANSISVYTDTKVWSEISPTGWKKTSKGYKAKTQNRVVFYGYSVDVELANYIYNMCDIAMESEWRKFAHNLPTGQRAKQRKSFMVGMAVRLKERLQSMKKQNVESSNGSQLVVMKMQLVEAAHKKEFTFDIKAKSTSVKYTANNAFDEGKKAADRVRFNREVEDGPQGGVKLIA